MPTNVGGYELTFKQKVMGTGNSLLCFIAGAVAGAVTAVLLAPESGEKTRARIRQGASNVVGQAKGRIVEGLEILEGALEDK